MINAVIVEKHKNCRVVNCYLRQRDTTYFMLNHNYTANQPQWINMNVILDFTDCINQGVALNAK